MFSLTMRARWRVPSLTLSRDLMTAGTEPMLNLTQIIITAFGFLSGGPELQEPVDQGHSKVVVSEVVALPEQETVGLVG